MCRQPFCEGGHEAEMDGVISGFCDGRHFEAEEWFSKALSVIVREKVDE